MCNMVSDKDIKNAFIRASDARILFPLDDEYWLYFLEGSEEMCGYYSLWNDFKKFLKEHFNNDVNLYNYEFHKIRRTFEDLGDFFSEYKTNITKEMYNPELYNFTREKKNLGKLLHNKHYYLSIDLKNAAFQCLDYFKCLGNETFSEYLTKITEHPEILQFRGNKIRCWDEVTIRAGQQYLLRMCFVILSKFYESDHKIMKYIRDNNLQLSNIRTDELMFHIGEENNIPEDILNEFCGKDIVFDGLIFHINVYQYNLIHYTLNGEEMFKSFLDNVITGKRKFNAKNCTYMWHLNKLYEGEELTEKDMVIIGGDGLAEPFTLDIKILEDNEQNTELENR